MLLFLFLALVLTSTTTRIAFALAFIFLRFAFASASSLFAFALGALLLAASFTFTWCPIAALGARDIVILAWTSAAFFALLLRWRIRYDQQILGLFHIFLSLGKHLFSRCLGFLFATLALFSHLQLEGLTFLLLPATQSALLLIDATCTSHMVLRLRQQILAGVGLHGGHFNVEARLVTVNRKVLEVSKGR